MSIRVTVCFLFVLGFSFYAYRNWFVSLCATIFLMAFVKHPDMPKQMFGIPGFNMWNLLLVNVVVAWWIQRRREGLVWDMSPGITIAVALYATVVVIAFLRLLIDPTRFYEGDTADIVVDFFINSLKFLIPALLFYDGCRTRERSTMAITAIVVLYFLLAVQVVRYVGLHPDFSGSELSGRAAKIIQRSVGYNRVDMSMMLAGASWATIALSNLVEKRSHRWLVRAMAIPITLGLALTGGRGGYLTWGLTGFVLCTLRWWKLLPLIPVAAIAVVVLIPGVGERMFSGYGGKSGNIVIQQDESAMTSGRNLVWPLVIGKIKQNPLIGYGRLGMATTGLADFVREELNDSFPHPHEAYLEMMLDSGIIGLLCVLPIYFIALKRGGALFRDRQDPVFEAVGGVALALVLALLFAGFGAQTLYPRESVVGMWAAIGVALRTFVERRRRQLTIEDGPDEYLDTAEEVQPIGV